MQVAKWGNSLAIRIPAAVAEALELKAGDEVEIHVEGAREFAMRRKPSREDLLKRLRALRGRLTPISSSTGTRRMSGDFFDTDVLLLPFLRRRGKRRPRREAVERGWRNQRAGPERTTVSSPRTRDPDSGRGKLSRISAPAAFP